MASTEGQAVEVRIVGAKAEPPSFVLAAGIATQPFSVGGAGQWVVAGEGVAPVHLFIGFDGQRIHVVAASPSLPVLLAGSRVGGTWVAAPIPSEIRFGAACLMIRSAAPSGVLAHPDPVPSTVSDGGALLQAAQRAAGLGGAAAPARKDFGSTVLMQQRPPSSVAAAATQVAPVEPAAPPPPESPGQEEAVSEPARGDSAKAMWKAASPVKKITLALMPVAVLATLFMLRDEPTKRVRPAGIPSAQTKSATPGPVAPLDRSPSEAGAAKADARAVRSNSEVALAVIPSSAAPSSLASALKAPPAFVFAKAGQRTPEREALEAVAAGSFEDAAGDYEALASAHPDDPTFKEAARVLHAKAGRVH